MTVVCPHCKRPAGLVEDERSGRAGYSCRDLSCAGSRSFIDTSPRAQQNDRPSRQIGGDDAR